MLVKAVLGALVLSFATVIITVTLPAIAENISDVRTEASQETGLGCSTGVGETSCSVTLAAEHAYPDTTDMTVTETSPGSADWTSATTVGTDRATLTVTGLTASTSYTFTVDYRAVAANIGDPLNSVLTFVPFLWGLGGVLLVAVAVVVGLGMYISKRR